MISAKKGRITRPWLWVSSKLAHDSSPYVLPLIAKLLPSFDNNYRPLEWRGLKFSNPLGIAGGVDKTGLSLQAWQQLGAGFLEVGTVTPEPQEPNPGLIMDRDIKKEALWNKMGFPNAGAVKLAQRLKKAKKLEVPLFVNIGKNRWTENSQAHLDYIQCVKLLEPFADAFVVNISSPNTKGLRDLLNTTELESFLNSLKEGAQKYSKGKAFLLKLSPDMDEETLEMVFKSSAPYMDGWILTNTTKQRYENSHFNPSEGGMSGRPLCELSRQTLSIAAKIKKTHPDKLLISVGGIYDESEIKKRLEMGADLVQVYSSLVFSGPSFFKKSIKALQKHS